MNWENPKKNELRAWIRCVVLWVSFNGKFLCSHESRDILTDCFRRARTTWISSIRWHLLALWVFLFAYVEWLYNAVHRLRELVFYCWILALAMHCPNVPCILLKCCHKHPPFVDVEIKKLCSEGTGELSQRKEWSDCNGEKASRIPIPTVNFDVLRVLKWVK